MNEEFESLLNTNIVCIGEDFLKDYLRDIEPEYFKVYIYALWKKEKIEISKASEETGLTENDVERACKFLIKKKIINKDILKNIKTDNYINLKDNYINFKDTKKELIKKDIKDDDKFKEILFIAEKITGDTLTERMANVLEECYNFLKFDESLIQYLLEYCICNTDNINANYVRTIAMNWYENGIKTPEQAKQYTKKRAINKKAIEEKENKKIIKQYDIPEEFDYKKYVDTYNFKNLDMELYKQDIKDKTKTMPYKDYMEHAINHIKDNIEQENFNIFFIGATGTGKSHLSRCVGTELYNKNKSVLYINTNTYLDNCFDKDFENYAMNCDLLILDDLGNEIENELSIKKLNNIIATRLDNKKSMVINTGYTINELKDVYLSSMLSRIINSFVKITLCGNDLRRIINL